MLTNLIVDGKYVSERLRSDMSLSGYKSAQAAYKKTYRKFLDNLPAEVIGILDDDERRRRILALEKDDPALQDARDTLDVACRVLDALYGREVDQAEDMQNGQ